MTGRDTTGEDAQMEVGRAPSKQNREDEAARMTEEEMREEYMRTVRIGGLAPLAGPIVLAEYDVEWPRLFEREEQRIRGALGARVLMLEHVGSTSVPGLAAKPRIDMLLIVEHSVDEASYVPALETAGYVLQIREKDWYEHRLLNGPDTAVNLHVFSQGCAEIQRMLLFRDWLRSHEADRLLYERAKRELVSRKWKYTQNYADAKTEVVEAILARAKAEGMDR